MFLGEQPAILDRDLFEAVQAKLSEQLNNHTAARAKSESPLIGRIYDDRGNRKSPSHARKQGIRYRYYVSAQGGKAAIASRQGRGEAAEPRERPASVLIDKSSTFPAAGNQEGGNGERARGGDRT